MAKYDEAFVLRTLQEFISEGRSVLEDERTDRENAWKMWNREFTNKNLPKGMLYYPKARAYGGYIQRSIVKTFTQAPELMSVSPMGSPGSSKSAQIAEAKHRLMSSIQKEQENELEKFYDDTAISGVVTGGMIGKIEWERRVRKYKQVTMQTLTDPDSGMPLEQVEVSEDVEEVLSNRSRKMYIQRENFIWDTNTKTWPDAKWCIEMDSIFSKGDLVEAIEDRGYNKKLVMDLVEKGMSGKTTDPEDSNDDEYYMGHPKAKENEPIRVNIFWGLIPLHEYAHPEFCRIEFPNDSSGVLMLSSENDEDAEKYIYFWPGKVRKPMIPYSVGYLEPKQNSVWGDSMMLMSRSLQMEENNVRNSIRKNTENSLRTMWLFRKGSGIDPSQIKNRDIGSYAWTTADDVRKAATQFPFTDRNPMGYADLAMAEKDWQMIYGATSYNMGISDPSNADTAYGIAQMQNAANQIVYAKIDRYSTTFLEPLLRMEMALIPQFMDEEQMLEYGVDLRSFGITRDDMLHDSKITLDTSYGATNNMARRQMATTLYFGLQQRIKYLLSLGAKLPPKDMWGPVEMFDKLMVMSGERGIRRYSSTQEEVVAYNKAIVDRQMKDYQEQAQNTQQLEETILDEARMAGENAAMQQMAPAQEAQQ